MLAKRIRFGWVVIIGVCLFSVARFPQAGFAQDDDVPPLFASLVEQSAPDERTLRVDLNILRADGSALNVLNPASVTAIVPSGRDPVILATTSAVPVPLDARLPLSLVLVVDLTDTVPINAVRSELPILVRGLAGFPNAEVSIIRFSNQVEPERPFASDFETAATEISAYDVQSVPVNSNVVVDAMRAAANLVSRSHASDPNREYVIVMVTDAVDTVYGNQGAVSEIVGLANGADARLYVIAMPSFSVPPSPPDNELPNLLVNQIGGFAYIFPPDGELDRDNASLFLGGQIANLQTVLASRFRVEFSLDPLRGLGLSGDLPLQITIRDGESVGIVDSLLNYSETEYNVRFEALTPNQQVTDQVMLQVSVEPQSSAYQYQFVIDGEEPIACSDPTTPSCAWNSDVYTPGLRVIGVNVVAGGSIVASGLLPLNVYRTDLNVDAPPAYLAGTVTLSVATSGLGGDLDDGADTAILYASIDGVEERLETVALGRDSTAITFDVEQLRELGNVDETVASAPLSLRVELINQARGLLISRWESAGESQAVFAPSTFTFDEPAPNIDVTGAIDVGLLVRPELPDTLPIRYEILINEQTLACDQATPTCTWDTDTFLPAPSRGNSATGALAQTGLTTLIGRLYVGSSLLAQTAPINLNVYREDLALIVPQQSVSTVPITVDTRRYGNAGNLLVFTFTYEDGEPFERTALVADGGETQFALDLDAVRALYPSADTDGTADISVSVRLVNNTQNNRLVAVSTSQSLRGLYTPLYQVALTGIPAALGDELPLLANDALPTLTITADPAPEPLLGDQLVLYRIIDGIETPFELARTDQGELTVPLLPAAFDVGRNTLSAAVVRDGAIISSPVIFSFNVYRALTGVSLLPAPGVLETNALSSIPAIRVNSAGFPDAGVIRIYIDGTQALPDVSASQGSESVVDIPWDVQGLYFNDASDADERRTVDLRVDLLDENGRLLLGRYEQSGIVLRPVATFALAVSGIDNGAALYADAPAELAVGLNPAPAADQVLYTLILDVEAETGSQASDRVIASASSADPTLRFTPNAVTMLPGLHRLIINANAVVGDAPLLDQQSFTVRVVDRRTIQPFGDFRIDPITGLGTLRGGTQLQLLTGADYPGATKLQLRFQPEDTALSATPLLITEVTLDENNQVTAPVNWQTQVFSVLNVNEPIPGVITMNMLDATNQLSYEWSGAYTLLPDDTLPFYIWLPAVVVSGIFGLTGYRRTLKTHRAYRLEREQRPPAPGSQSNAASKTRPVSGDLADAVLAYYTRTDQGITDFKIFSYMNYMLRLTVGRRADAARGKPHPDIMFDSQAVSRNVGRITMEQGEWRFYPEKTLRTRLKVNGQPFEQSQHWNKNKHFLRLGIGLDVSADADDRHLFSLMSMQEAMRRIKR